MRGIFQISVVVDLRSISCGNPKSEPDDQMVQKGPAIWANRLSALLLVRQRQSLRDDYKLLFCTRSTAVDASGYIKPNKQQSTQH